MLGRARPETGRVYFDVQIVVTAAPRTRVKFVLGPRCATASDASAMRSGATSAPNPTHTFGTRITAATIGAANEPTT